MPFTTDMHDTSAPNAATPVLLAEDLSFSWPGSTTACLDIHRLALNAGEHVLLLGPSGGGKSTLLGLLGGVLRADHIGFIFQQFNLVPYLSLEDNVLLPCHFSSIRRARAGSQPRETARRLLAALELPESAWSRPVTGLSVGQQQRAAVARALIGRPELLIADEPTSALDGRNRDRLLSLLMAQLESSGATLLVVSHDEQLRPYFGRILQMDDINTAEAA